MNLRERLKQAKQSLYVQEDPKPEEKPVPSPSLGQMQVTNAVPVVVRDANIWGQTNEPAPLPDDSAKYYGKLAFATKPSTLNNIGKLLEIAAKLESAIADRSVRLNAALATSDVTKDAVLADAAILVQRLESERDKFNAQVASSNTALIANAQQSAESLKAEIEKKQTDLQNLLVTIEKNKAQIATAQSSFAQAYERRSSELTKLSSELSVLK